VKKGRTVEPPYITYVIWRRTRDIICAAEKI
jgi:hypothetical protein